MDMGKKRCWNVRRFSRRRAIAGIAACACLYGCTPKPDVAPTSSAAAPAVRSSATQPPPSTPQAPYNVLLIISDDLNTDLGCYGHPQVKSPHIDRLAARGVRFDRAYCQFPLCNPSRASMLTGLRPDTLKLYGNWVAPNENIPDAVFLPEYFRQHGYRTGRFGKVMHEPFEHLLSWDEGTAPPWPRRPRDETTSRPTPTTLPLKWAATSRDDSAEKDGQIARAAVRFLEREKASPFFLSVGLNRPHEPFNAPRKYFDLYPPPLIALPDEPADDAADIPEIARFEYFPQGFTPPKRRQFMAAYYAGISFMDAQVGLLIDALDRLGLSDRTIVVFLGDHGFLTGQHGGLWRKEFLFEEALRVPLVIVAPGRSRGAVSPRLVELIDLFPTLIELCGLPPIERVEADSLAPVLDDVERPWKRAAFSQIRRRGDIMGRSVRTERYRFNDWGEGQAFELYDHASDPHEYVNLANDPAYAATVAEMRRILEAGWKAARP